VLLSIFDSSPLDTFVQYARNLWRAAHVMVCDRIFALSKGFRVGADSVARYAGTPGFEASLLDARLAFSADAVSSKRRRLARARWTMLAATHWRQAAGRGDGVLQAGNDCAHCRQY
jgi:hypothetical protein